MIILDGSGESLIGVLGQGISTSQPEFSCSFADIAAADLDLISGASSNSGAFNSTTNVDLVAAPSGSDERDIKYIHIHNADTISHTFIIKHSTRTIFRFTLESLGSATYSSEHGWIVYDSDGQSGIAGPQGPSGVTDTTVSECTSDATPTDVVLADDCSLDGTYKLYLKVNAYGDTPLAFGYDEVYVYRTTSGTMTGIGSMGKDIVDEIGGMSVSHATDGTGTITITLTGIAATNINWEISYHFDYVTSGSCF